MSAIFVLVCKSTLRIVKTHFSFYRRFNSHEPVITLAKHLSHSNVDIHTSSRLLIHFSFILQSRKGIDSIFVCS